MKGESKMPILREVQSEIYDYCTKHLPNKEWYQNEFEFVNDELELSKLAYRRLRPFIDQIKEKLKADKKGIYQNYP